MHVFAKILIKEKYRLKTIHFLLKIGINKPSLRQNMTSFDFRCRIISVKLLVFGVKIFSQKMHSLLLKFIKNKCSIYNN